VLALELLTLAETAHSLRQCRRTIANWRNAGYGPLGFKIGSRWFYYASDVERFVAGERAREAHAVLEDLHELKR
jgi:hypothetical protein